MSGNLVSETTVMLVDDDYFIREVVSTALRTVTGVRVQAFAAAADAVVAARAARPDIIVLDYTLPGTDGLALARELRGVIAAMPPLIFLTAREDAGLIRQLRSEGAAARPAAVSMLDVGLAFATVLVGIAIAVMIFIEAPKGS